LKKTRIC